MKTVFALLLLVGSAFAQGFVAGGYIYNGRENDHGAWVETGARFHRRYEVAVGFSKMADTFQFREAQVLARYRVARDWSVEGGYALGAACFQPEGSGHGCAFHGTVRTRTPLLGVQWVSPRALKGWLRPVVRLDFVRWQLPPTRGKDDGFRLYVGVRLGGGPRGDQGDQGGAW